VRKLIPLTELFAVSAIVLACHPDNAQAQQLYFSPDQPIQLSISGPGGTDTKSTIASSTPGTVTAVSSISVGPISTSGGGSWLCAGASGGTLTISAGIAGCATTQLSPNVSYNGIIVINSPGFTQRTLAVILTVGTSSGGTAGLVANPNPVNISSTIATSQTINITYNSAAATIVSVTTSGQSWLSASTPFQGAVTVNVNPAGLSGTNSGTIFVTTTVGPLNIPVNFTVGTGTTSGFSTSPSPVTFTLPAGSASQSQTVNTFYNGNLVGVTNFSTSGQSWLQVANTSFNSSSLLVTAIPQLFSGTSDTGTVTVTTQYGTFSFQVTLTISSGSSSGLTVSPNSLALNVPFGAASNSQNVSVFYNGVLTPITSVSATTANGQPWLSATNPNSTGTVTVSWNPSILGTGTYTGNVLIGTQLGQATLSVTLSVGTGTSSGLVATPSTLNFNIPIIGAGATPSSQTVNITYNGATTQIQSVTSSAVGQNWLLLNTGTSSVTVGINGASLTQGTYSATVTVNTLSGPATFQVTLNVATGGTTMGFVTTPNPVPINVSVGSASTSQSVSVSYNGSPASITSVSSSTSTGQNWLQAAASGVAGGVTLTVTPSALQAGSYSGTVTVNTTTGPTMFQVNLTVGSGSGTSGLVATPNPVNFTAAVGGSAPSQNVNITASGVPATISSVSATTTTGQNWVQASTSSTGVVTVNVTPSILVAGSYTGTVTVNTTSGITSFQVNLTVGSGGTPSSGLVANPSPITFNVAAAGQNPTQNVTVTLNGAAAPITSFTFAPVPVLGPNFLNLATNADGSVTLTVNNVVTTPGIYQGTLTLYTSTGGVSVPVTLTFGSSGGGTGGLVANPNTLNFSVQVGGSAGAQNVAITFNGAPVTVTGATGSASWLVPSFSSAVAGSVTVGVNPAGLVAGTYTGTVTVTTTSGTVSFQVNLQVGGTPPSTSPTIVASPSSLAAVSFQIGGANPQTQTLSISLQGGGAANFTASASTSTGGQWLTVSPANGTTPGSVTVTINPAGLAAGAYQGSVSIAIPLATNSPVTLPITLTVTPAPVIKPAVVAIQNAASTLPTSLSPGLNILIFGSNMGPGTLTVLQVGSNGTLATTVAGTQVTFDGTAAPIIFTSGNLVSVMVPYEIANKVSTSMVVMYNGVASDPVNLRVVTSAPGIYTVNQSGSGQGAILNQNGTVNSANNPETSGNVIQIFATGEGVTTPAGATGALVPNRLPLPRPSLPVAVTIGGRDVPDSDILYVGEAPGLVSGVIQINARIPAGVGPGPVPVVIRIGGLPSQSNVTVSVR
jgi:uncharacterized protein (TIGR03437 family)